MSRVHFHSPDRESAVYGSERAHLYGLCREITFGLLEDNFNKSGGYDIEPYLVGFNPHWRDDGAQHDPYLSRLVKNDALRTWLGAGMFRDTGLKIGDTVVPTSELSLNTAMALGSDALALGAKIAGTCEDYAYIEPEDCAWLADIIDAGRAVQIFRTNGGWEDVADHARSISSGAPGPLVLSYSVCESFPHGLLEAPECDVCEGSGEPSENMKFTDVDYDYCTTCGGDGTLWDAIYDLTPEEQWHQATESMRKRKYNRNISPDNLRWGFLEGETVLDFLATLFNHHEVPPNG